MSKNTNCQSNQLDSKVTLRKKKAATVEGIVKKDSISEFRSVSSSPEHSTSAGDSALDILLEIPSHNIEINPFSDDEEVAGIAFIAWFSSP